MVKKVLALDFGATSARAVIGFLQDGKTVTEEIYRFENKPLRTQEGLFWDIESLTHNFFAALEKASAYGITSIGIDTWGVDYVLIPKSGVLPSDLYGLRAFHYRDRRTEKPFTSIMSLLGEAELYKKTGIQPMRINTMYQLLAEDREKVCGKKLLFMPDFFAHLLTGVIKSEFTIASTSGLLDMSTQNWSYDFIEGLGIPESIFADIIMPGEVYGTVSSGFAKSRLSETAFKRLEGVPVTAVCTHDTASAAMCADEEGTAFISCGTWSLVGTVTEKPIISDSRFANEGGYGGRITYLKNITGMWLAEEVRRNLKDTGSELSFAELDKAVEAACGGVISNKTALIDPQSPDFELPPSMLEAIKQYCKKTGQAVPLSIGEVMLVIYNSLAESYKKTVAELEENTKTAIKSIHILGGGSKNKYLAERTAYVTGLPVKTGPAEATAEGNVLAQLKYK